MPSSAVYAAEDQWSAVLDRGGTVDFFGSRVDVPIQRRFGDLASVQRYVADVLAEPYVTDNYPGAGPVTVRERAGQRGAHYEPAGGIIAVPLRAMWAARESVVLHEVAHHLACSAGRVERGPRWHGAQYRAAMCGLVSAVIGDAAALLLRAGYEENGVRA